MRRRRSRSSQTTSKDQGPSSDQYRRMAFGRGSTEHLVDQSVPEALENILIAHGETRHFLAFDKSLDGPVQFVSLCVSKS